MNQNHLMNFLQRGSNHAASDAERAQSKNKKIADELRKTWLDALLVDQTRAWMSIGEEAPDLLSAMATLLTIGGMVHVFDKRTEDTADMRVIRGAISAATQRAGQGGSITAEDAVAFTSGCTRAVRAVDAIEQGSVPSILQAARQIRIIAGLDKV